jgi:hypothetical protein
LHTETGRSDLDKTLVRKVAEVKREQAPPIGAGPVCNIGGDGQPIIGSNSSSDFFASP